MTDRQTPKYTIVSVLALVAIAAALAMVTSATAEEESADVWVAETAAADGLSVEPGSVRVRQENSSSRLRWALVSYQTDLGLCLDAYALDADSDALEGMIGGCGYESGTGIQESWVAGTILTSTGPEGVAFGIAPDEVASVYVTLSDGKVVSSVLGNGTWLSTFQVPNDKWTVVRIEALDRSGAPLVDLTVGD